MCWCGWLTPILPLPAVGVISGAQIPEVLMPVDVLGDEGTGGADLKTGVTGVGAGELPDAVAVPVAAVRRVDLVSGCFFLIEKELWDGLNGFDPLFFMYGEEADLCLRAHAFSARPLVTPDATIIHHGGASENVRSDKMVRLLAAKMSLIMRHFHPAAAPFGRFFLALWPLSRSGATSLIAFVTRSPSALEAAATWREVWRRRREWIGGYLPQPTVSRAPALYAPSPL